MPITEHYHGELRFLVTIATGELDDSSVCQHINELNRITEGVADLRELAV